LLATHGSIAVLQLFTTTRLPPSSSLGRVMMLDLQRAGNAHSQWSTELTGSDEAVVSRRRDVRVGQTRELGRSRPYDWVLSIPLPHQFCCTIWII